MSSRSLRKPRFYTLFRRSNRQDEGLEQPTLLHRGNTGETPGERSSSQIGFPCMTKKSYLFHPLDVSRSGASKSKMPSSRCLHPAHKYFFFKPFDSLPLDSFVPRKKKAELLDLMLYRS